MVNTSSSVSFGNSRLKQQKCCFINVSMFFFLSGLSLSARQNPVLNEDCPYFNTYTYMCESSAITDTLIIKDGLINCKDTSLYYNPETNACEAENGRKHEKGIIINDDSYTIINSIKFFDGSDEYADAYEATYADSLISYQKLCKNNASNYAACQFLASACALNGYNAQSEACIVFNSLPYDSIAGINEYSYWYGDKPWIEYEISGDSVLKDEYVENGLTSGDNYNIYLAKYSIKTGEFLGFEKLTDQFIKCTNNRANAYSWRVFGTNVQSNCAFNLSQYIENGKEEVVEPFYAEVIDGTTRLRPIPVFIRNYVNGDGDSVNLGKNERKYRFFRRFFTLDRSSRSDYTVYASNITLVWRTDGITRPRFEVTYDRVKNEFAESASSVFQAIYERDISGFWTAAMIVIIVIGIVAVAFWLFRIYVLVKRYGDDGVDLFVIVGAFGELALTVSVLCFVISWIFSFYVFCAYKWDLKGLSAVPAANEYWLLTPMMWTSFACAAVAVFIKIAMRLRSDVFVMDWENPGPDEPPPPAWRRILVANEWLKILTTRQVCIPLTLAILVFLLDGLKIDLQAAAAPTADLVDTGITYPIFRYAFSAFITMLAMLFVLGVTRIIWLIFGSPITNFVELCASTNTSVLAMISRSWGYYVHGRSSHQTVDGGYEKLMADTASIERSGESPIQSITESREDRVFEVFLAEEFRERLTKAYERVLEIHGQKPHNLRSVNVSKVPVQAMASFDRLNEYLTSFFGAQREVRTFDAIDEPFISKLFGITPERDTRSIFYRGRNGALSHALLGGLEWVICLFDLLLFVTVHVETQSACIAAFSTYIIDAVILATFRSIGRRNLARKALLDERFLIH